MAVLWITGLFAVLVSVTADVDLDQRFIVEGSGNEVNNNHIENNENKYATDSSTSGSSGSTSGASCDYQGQHHGPGVTFPAGDGCNTCSCSPLGAACTTNFCSGKRDIDERFIVEGSGNEVNNNHIENNENTFAGNSQPSGTGSGSSTGGGSSSSSGGASCDYQGQHYGPGVVFPAGDGCNTCTCSPLGAACTTNFCSGKRDIGKAPKRFIVEGDNNHVDGNTVTNNENTYANTSTKGGRSSTGGTSGRVVKKFIVTGSNNNVDGNTITNNENTYTNTSNSGGNNGGTSSSSTGGTSGSTTGGTSGGGSFTASCDYDGHHYGPGVVFPEGDGCNTCTCSPLGAACTTNLCGGKRAISPFGRRFIVAGDRNHVNNNEVVNNENGISDTSGVAVNSASGGSSTTTGLPGSSTSGRSKTCIYHGQTYHDNEIFPAFDGCNKCMCYVAGPMCTRNTCTTGATMTVLTSTSPYPSATAKRQCLDSHPNPQHCKQNNICNDPKAVLFECKKTCGTCSKGLVGK